ncbi:GC-rich sequence DNA-binding factor-like protein-domain-containing protein [Lophiotrema nucula]|uniref:GC-rich sequence DNA-binding factor-like protein-domain-containing protein n=1 Tax=Lophiotrema nucula TaxID=690887 RepID=A0A6A5ZAF3_9PLEO|nr:GC-rich sequence DNA-binding factor-like protein-domain-containing protein [Lophiotrema nucula]
MNGVKRKIYDGAQTGSRKSAKSDSDDAPSGKKLSFAERMMAKMGHKAGTGLGKEGTGRTAPIQVTVRPTKVGLGAVSEISAADRAEQKKQKKARGEEVEDSEDEEKTAEKRRRKLRSATGSGASTPKIKTKYKTVVEAQEDGLHIPPSMLEIYDATGKTSKLLTASDGLLSANVVPAETTESKLARKVRLDLEAYSDSYVHLSNSMKDLSFQEMQLQKEMDALDDEIDRSREILAQVTSMGSLASLQAVVEELNSMARPTEQVAVAALRPHFQRDIRLETLEDESAIVPELLRLGTVLGIRKSDLVNGNLPTFQKPRQKATPFESMLLSDFQPRARQLLVTWDVVHQPYDLVRWLSQWSEVIPPWLYNDICRTVRERLMMTLQSWNARSTKKRHAFPDILPILKALPPSDAKEVTSVLKSKVATALRGSEMTKPPTWLEEVGKVLPVETLVVNNVLPRLATLLKEDFTLDPSNQDLEVWNRIAEWHPYFSPTVFGELLARVFAPKFFEILQLWLSSPEANYEEIAVWLKWSRETFAEAVNVDQVPTVQEIWQKGFEYIHQALDLGENVDTLPVPQLDTIEAPQPVQNVVREPENAGVQEMTFKDIVELWAGEENLLLLPMREAHQTTGLPLFRITASATGKGGVLVYIKGDVLYAQNRKEKASWDAIGLGEQLVQMAEGK